MTDNELQKSHWRHVTGVVTPGGDPYYECPSCEWGRCYGIEHREEMPDVCPNCGMRMKENMTVFDYIKARVVNISDNLASTDGRYPTWDITSLSMLLDALEKDWNGQRKYKCELACSAETVTTGTMMLTREEYEMIKRVTNPENWDDLKRENWCGSFDIYCKELEDE